MLDDALWETYFNKRDFYCDVCIEDRMGRDLCLLDLLSSRPWCNERFIEYRKRMGRELKSSYGQSYHLVDIPKNIKKMIRDNYQKEKCICQECGTEIFVDQNMVMIRDKIWFDELHFNRKDIYCDGCITKHLGRPIELSDLKGDYIPCNMFWLGNKKMINL